MSGPATAAAPEKLPLDILLTDLTFLFVAIISLFAKVASNSVPSTIFVFFQSFISLHLSARVPRLPRRFVEVTHCEPQLG